MLERETMTSNNASRDPNLGTRLAKLGTTRANLAASFRRAGSSRFDDTSRKSGASHAGQERALPVKNTPVVQQVRQKFHFTVGAPWESLEVGVWASPPARISGFTTYDIRGRLFHRGIRTCSSWQFVRRHRRARQLRRSTLSWKQTGRPCVFRKFDTLAAERLLVSSVRGVLNRSGGWKIELRNLSPCCITD